MIDPRPIASLRLDEARVFLEPEVQNKLFGQKLSALAGEGHTCLVEALASISGSPADWRGRLAGLFTVPLDVNTAARTALARIPLLSPAQIELLIQLRPYFSLADLRRHGADFQEIADVAERYLAHAGYLFFDKPQQIDVELAPAEPGLIMHYTAGATAERRQKLLQAAGLQEIGHDTAERLLVCRWQLPEAERASRQRALKLSDTVQTIAPVLSDRQGQLRLPYPDRLDLALHSGSSQEAWNSIVQRFHLELVQLYKDNYGSLRVPSHQHDLGALYHAMRALVREANVRFVEPTYMAVEVA